MLNLARITIVFAKNGHLNQTSAPGCLVSNGQKYMKQYTAFNKHVKLLR